MSGKKSLFRFFGKMRERKRRTTLARRQLADMADRTLFLQGRMASRATPVGRRIRDLSDVEFKVYSQWGEDGIIDWLVSHVEMPNDRFVEFGVEAFDEANCRFLLRNRNWKGLVLDGSEANMTSLRSQPLYWMHDLTAKAAFITTDNIDGLIAGAGFGGPLGILSVDIDGNDYWVWEAMTCVAPAIVICEVNPVFGDTRAVTVPYDPAFRRFISHHSGLHFGASIAALIHLAGKKGYRFVGTSSTGINAFFVKDELARPVLDLIETVKAFPPRHRDSRDESGRMTFLSGMARFDAIRDMPVIDVITGERLLLRDIEQPYSAEWLRAIT